MDNIILLTGGFDPIHSGHIAAINEAKKLGRVIIGLNSDEWLTRKKGRPFMNFNERKCIIEQFKSVSEVIDFNDDDNSACAAIEKVKTLFPNNKIIFVNGGDRTKTNIPELEKFKDDPQIEFLFEVGGENKKNSSSWILSEWKAPKTQRPWGYYRVLHTDGHHTKVKELTVAPGESLSMQKHFKRNELWLVSEGKAQLSSRLDGGYATPTRILNKHDYVKISQNEWHKLSNPYNEPCKIVEIQYGEICEESDIERL